MPDDGAMLAAEFTPPLAAEIVTLEALLSKGRFSPAAVQREYRWRLAQVDALWSDLWGAFAARQAAAAPGDLSERESAVEPPAEEDDGGMAVPLDLEGESDIEGGRGDPAQAEPGGPPPYYLGSVMLAPRAPGRFEIYDGLQRLTTLTALLAVLRDRLPPEAASEAERLIHDSAGEARLRLEGRDRTLQADVQRPAATRQHWRHADGLTDAGLRLREAVVFMRREAQRLDTATLAAFAAFLRREVQLALILVRGPRLAYQVFVTTNDRGLALDRGDVLKGQVVELVSAGGGPERGEAVARIWSEQAHLAGDRFETLLRAIDFIQRRKPQGPDALAGLFEHFAHRHGPQGAAAFIEGPLCEYGVYFARLRRHEGLEWAEGLDAACRRLALLPFGEWLPVALVLAQRRRPARAEQDMAALARASFIVLLKGYSARDRATIYGRAIRQLAERRNPFNGALRFDETAKDAARKALAGPFHDPESRSAVVRTLEAAHWPEALPSHLLCRRRTIEHVLPCRPAPGSEWIDLFPDPEERAALTNTIGNLALLPAEDNEALGNRPFEQKRPVYKRLREEYRLLRGLHDLPAWTPQTLRARTQALAAIACEDLGL